MAAIAFDSLQYANQLEAAGMPREQAEVVAKGLTAMFIHNFDSLVTKDYLDTRFSEMGVRIDKRFADLRLEIAGDSADFRLEVRGDSADLRLEVHGDFANLRGEVGELRGTLNLHSWMLALLIAGIFLPLFQDLVS